MLRCLAHNLLFKSESSCLCAKKNSLETFSHAIITDTTLFWTEHLICPDGLSSPPVNMMFHSLHCPPPPTPVLHPLQLQPGHHQPALQLLALQLSHPAAVSIKPAAMSSISSYITMAYITSTMTSSCCCLALSCSCL